MNKEFIASRIEAASDSSPYIYISFSDSSDYKPGAEKQQSPFGPNVMAFTSPDDLMRNLPKAMSNISKMMGGVGVSDSPTFKVSMKEYEDMNIRVGDKVTINIKKSDGSTGI